ncbi:hypothetical protein UPYG_G00077460 [Umbra pygmaea]|uniref:Uncharacterized protein n=1 Tax=Umbra pygmaea TaxID=75934 RepID=A0ABD0XDH3_UMBPY
MSMPWIGYFPLPLGPVYPPSPGQSSFPPSCREKIPWIFWRGCYLGCEGCSGCGVPARHPTTPSDYHCMSPFQEGEPGQAALAFSNIQLMLPPLHHARAADEVEHHHQALPQPAPRRVPTQPALRRVPPQPAPHRAPPQPAELWAPTQSAQAEAPYQALAQPVPGPPAQPVPGPPAQPVPGPPAQPVPGSPVQPIPGHPAQTTLGSSAPGQPPLPGSCGLPATPHGPACHASSPASRGSLPGSGPACSWAPCPAYSWAPCPACSWPPCPACSWPPYPACSWVPCPAYSRAPCSNDSWFLSPRDTTTAGVLRATSDTPFYGLRVAG